MTSAAIEIPNELIKALGTELLDYAKDFACRAGDVQDNFQMVGLPKANLGLGDLWMGKDYAWRILLNPSFQVEVMMAIGNRHEHAVAEKQLNLVCPILEALSESMPDDAMIDLMTEGEGAAEVLSENLLSYFAQVKTTSQFMEFGG